MPDNKRRKCKERASFCADGPPAWWSDKRLQRRVRGFKSLYVILVVGVISKEKFLGQTESVAPIFKERSSFFTVG